MKKTKESKWKLQTTPGELTSIIISELLIIFEIIIVQFKERWKHDANTCISRGIKKGVEIAVFDRRILSKKYSWMVLGKKQY